MLKLKVVFKALPLRAFLLVLSLALFAFTDSEYFRRSFDFQRVLYQYETLGPSKSYQQKIGIEIEGYYNEIRATDGGVSLTPFKDLIDLSRTTLSQNGFQPLRHQDLSKHERKSEATGLFFTGNDIEKRLMFISDISIFHPVGTKAVEIVSPILESQTEIDTFFAVLKSVRKERGFQSEPLNSGTHFHFDFNNPQREEMLILTIVIEKLLPEIKTAFAVQDSRAGTFAQDYSATDFESLVGYTKSVFPLQKTSKLNVHRHRASNWLALEKHGTFEFRLFNSTADPDLLSVQADLIGKIVKAVRLRDPRLLNLLKTENLSGLTLDAVAESLDCLIKDRAVKSYARETAENDVRRSKSISDKLIAQEAFTRPLGLNIHALITSHLRTSPTTQGNSIVSPPVNRAPENYPSISYSMSSRKRSNNQCIEFYK